jgi:hypothetical protein
LADATVHLFDDEILDEAGAGDDRGPGSARGLCIHVRTLMPIVIRGGEQKANHVFEHVRRRINLGVQGPPQGDPEGCLVWSCGSLVRHDALPFREWHQYRVAVGLEKPTALVVA